MKNARLKIMSATGWSMLTEIASKAISPLIFIVLAKILTPEDYGIASIALMIISFSQIFWDAGLEKALIQKKGNIKKAANVVFWTNLFLGVLMYAVFFLASGWLAAVFKDARIERVIQVQSAQIIIMSLCSVQTGLFKRNLDFKPLFWTGLITTAVPGFVSIPLALTGYKYWAFIWGAIIGSAAQALTLWVLSSWRPSFKYCLKTAKKMLSFGIWIVGDAFLAWCLVYFDLLIIGFFMTPHDVGLYNFGNKIILMMSVLLINPMMPVVYSYLSRIQDNFDRVKSITAASNKIVMMLILPASTALIAFSDNIANTVLGYKWSGVAVVIAVLGLRNIISLPVYGNLEAYRATGRPDVNTKILVISLLMYLPVCIMAAPYGLVIFLYSRLLITVFSLFIKFYYSKNILGIKFCDFIGSIKWQVLASIIMFITICAMKKIIVVNSIPALIIMASAGFFVYLAVIVFDKDLMLAAQKIIKENLQGVNKFLSEKDEAGAEKI